MTSTVNLVCCLLGLLTVISAVSLRSEDDEDVRKGNELVDKIIKDLHENYKEEYDPYYTKVLKLRRETTLVFVKVAAEASLNGSVEGLSTLKRSGDSALRKDDDDTLRLNSPLSVTKLNYTYVGTVKFLDFVHQVKASCTSSYMKVDLVTTFNSDGGNGKLERFEIKDLAQPKCKFEGFSHALNWFLELLIKELRIISQLAARTAITVTMTHHLEHEVPNYRFPVDE